MFSRGKNPDSISSIEEFRNEFNKPVRSRGVKSANLQHAVVKTYRDINTARTCIKYLRHKNNNTCFCNCYLATVSNNLTIEEVCFVCHCCQRICNH